MPRATSYSRSPRGRPDSEWELGGRQGQTYRQTQPESDLPFACPLDPFLVLNYFLQTGAYEKKKIRMRYSQKSDTEILQTPAFKTSFSLHRPKLTWATCGSSKCNWAHEHRCFIELSICTGTRHQKHCLPSPHSAAFTQPRKDSGRRGGRAEPITSPRYLKQSGADTQNHTERVEPAGSQPEDAACGSQVTPTSWSPESVLRNHWASRNHKSPKDPSWTWWRTSHLVLPPQY